MPIRPDEVGMKGIVAHATGLSPADVNDDLEIGSSAGSIMIACLARFGLRIRLAPSDKVKALRQQLDL